MLLICFAEVLSNVLSVHCHLVTGTKPSIHVHNHHPSDLIGNKSIQLADILANDCGNKLIILQFKLVVLHHSLKRLVGKASTLKNSFHFILKGKMMLSDH